MKFENPWQRTGIYTSKRKEQERSSRKNTRIDKIRDTQFRLTMSIL